MRSMQQPSIRSVRTCVVAAFLAFESKGLLIGEGVSPRTLSSIRTLAGKDEAVAEVKKALTMHFGPNEVLLALEVRFKKHLRATQIAEAINRLENRIREKHPEIRHIFIEAKSLKEAQPSET